jgi:diguanylate cyclase (GGDEF)-like protein
MLDIDHFKKVNDTYGHDIGDIVIKTLATTIKDYIKEDDLVARFGGEEFCIVLKENSSEEAISFFNNLNKKINDIKIKISQDEYISFTTSVGLCTLKKETLQEMINSADKLLYSAKNNGRNQVCSDAKETALID